MNKIKQCYEAPVAETLVVRFEGVICGSPLMNSVNHTQYITGGDDDDYEEL